MIGSQTQQCLLLINKERAQNYQIGREHVHTQGIFSQTFQIMRCLPLTYCIDRVSIEREIFHVYYLRELIIQHYLNKKDIECMKLNIASIT